MDHNERSPELKDKSDSSSFSPAADTVAAQHPDLERTQSIAQSMSPIREVLFVGLLCSTQFVTQAGLANTLLILHIIGDDLGITSPAILPWLIAGYSLTVGTFILLSGRCGDLFSYKLMVIIGFAWFALWNVVAGFSVYASGSGGSILFIFSRVMGGIGPAILMPNALGLLGSTYTEGTRKDMVFSLFAACAPSGAVVGGTFAGLWSLVWWPWTFWTFGIALAVLGVLSHFILPAVPIKEEEQGLSVSQKLKELDLLGATIGITAMILFNFAWNQAPGYGWDQPYVIALLIIGSLLFFLFFWIELRYSRHPLIPFDALSTDVIFVMVCEMCGWAAFGEYPSIIVSTKANISRYLGLLLRTILSAASGYLATLNNRTYLTCHNIRFPSGHNQWACNITDWPCLGHVDLDVRIHCWNCFDSYFTCQSDILGTDFRGHVDHSMGNGHEFSCWHTDHE